MTDVSTVKKLSGMEKQKKDIYNINYNNFKSRGGGFLITPFKKGSVFSC